jgi:hypothetical protein
MNLKNFGNNYVEILVLVEFGGPLIAAATPAAVTASPAVASTTVAPTRGASIGGARTACVVRADALAGCGLVSAAPAKMAGAVAGKIAAVRSGAVTHARPMAPAALPSRRQEVDQRRAADRNSEGRQRIAHGFPPFRRGWPVRRKRPRNSPYLSPNMATSFIDHSSEMWNFPCDSPLYPLSCSIRKVMP